MTPKHPVVIIDEILESIWQFIRWFIFEILWQKLPPFRYVIVVAVSFFVLLVIGGLIYQFIN